MKSSARKSLWLFLAVFVIASNSADAVRAKDVAQVQPDEASNCAYVSELKMGANKGSTESLLKQVRKTIAKMNADSFVIKSQSDNPLAVAVDVYNCEGKQETDPFGYAPKLVEPPAPKFVQHEIREDATHGNVAIIGYHVSKEKGRQVGGVSIEKVDGRSIKGHRRWNGVILNSNKDSRVITVRYFGFDGKRSTHTADLELVVRPGGRYLIHGYDDNTPGLLSKGKVHFWVTEVNSNGPPVGEVPEEFLPQSTREFHSGSTSTDGDSELTNRHSYFPGYLDLSSPNFFKDHLNSQ